MSDIHSSDHLKVIRGGVTLKTKTQSRKLLHIADAFLTVFINEKGGIRFFVVLLSFVRAYNFCRVLYFLVTWGGQRDRTSDSGIKAPNQGLKRQEILGIKFIYFCNWMAAGG